MMHTDADPNDAQHRLSDEMNKLIFQKIWVMQEEP